MQFANQMNGGNSQVVTDLVVDRSESSAMEMWDTYDDGGWQALADQRWDRAKRYFEQAIQNASELGGTDYRRGRTYTGLAWAEYRVAQRAKEDALKTGDPDVHFQVARGRVSEALNILENAELNDSGKQTLARAHHLCGLLDVELCDGTHAFSQLSKAADIYRGQGLQNDYLDVVHLLGKLHLCRRQLRKAAARFNEMLQQAPDSKRQFRALVDLANTYGWMGLLREAWQLRIRWRRLEQKLVNEFKTKPPKEELIRGKLAFARIAIQFGVFGHADELLCEAWQELESSQTPSCICCSVYWLLAAELAMHRSQFAKTDICLNEYAKICHKLDEAKLGYGCLEIIAIDAACQISVLETCCYEVWREECWCICGRWQIVFVKKTESETHVERVPANFGQILAELANFIRAKATFGRGRYESSDALARSSLAGIQGHLHTQTPIVIPHLVFLADVETVRRRSHKTAIARLNTAKSIAEGGSLTRHRLSSEQSRLLAKRRAYLSEHDLSEQLHRESLKHAEVYRSATHPNHVMGEIGLLLARANAAVGRENQHEVLSQCQEAIWKKISKLQSIVSCDDHRIGLALEASAWVSLLLGCSARAQSAFTRTKNYWIERDARIENIPATGKTELRDPRRAGAMLGYILSSIESHPDSIDADSFFREYVNLQRREKNNRAIAFELNGVGTLMIKADQRNAAKYCFDKSIELHPTQEFAGYRPDARENQRELAAPTGRLWTTQQTPREVDECK